MTKCATNGARYFYLYFNFQFFVQPSSISSECVFQLAQTMKFFCEATITHLKCDTLDVLRFVNGFLREVKKWKTFALVKDIFMNFETLPLVVQKYSL